MKQAVIYLRVSTLIQNPERQLFELQQYAKRLDWEIVAPFDDTISGTVKADKRQGFIDMMEYVTANSIKQIFVWEISRIGRNLTHSLEIINQLREQGINITSQKENINTLDQSASDKLQLGVFLILAEYERETIIERTLSGTQNSIRKGGTGGGGTVPYGYNNVHNMLIVDDYEADVVRDIFNKYLNEDYSVAQIANHLNESGIKSNYVDSIESGILKNPKRGASGWLPSTVSKLLHKPIYTGLRIHGAVTIQLNHLAIIDKDVYDSVQRKAIEKRKIQANAAVYENILRGKLVCGNCGAKMFLHKDNTGNMNHYKCYNRFSKMDKTCTSSMIDIDLLNNVVYDKAKDFQVASKDIEKRISELALNIKQNTTAINQLENELSSISKEEEQLVFLFRKNLIKITIYQSSIEEISLKAEQIKAKQQKLEATNIELKREIQILSSKKIVDLNNPAIFKSNIKDLVEQVTVKTLDEAGRKEIGDMVGQKIELVHKNRHKYYRVDIKMYDNKTRYVTVLSNLNNRIPRVITIDRI